MDEKTGGTPNPLNPNPTIPTDHVPESDITPPSKPIINEAKVQKPMQNPVQRPVRDPIQRPIQNPIQKPVRDPIRRPPVQSPIRESFQNPVHRPVQRPIQRPIQKPVHPVAEQQMPVKEDTTIEEPVSPSYSDPLDKPIVKTPEPEAKPKKKKNTGLIIGIIISLFVAIGCAVAAILLMINGNGSDAVSKAFNKIVNKETPGNISIDGNINFAINEPDSLFSNVGIKLSSDIVLNTMVNSTDAAITATRQDNGEQISVNIDEMYATSGDLYIRLNGITDAIEELITINNTEPTDVVDCLTDGDEGCAAESVTDLNLETKEDCIGDCLEAPDTYANSYELLDFLEAFSENPESVENTWIRISGSSLSVLNSGSEDASLKCLANLTNDLSASEDTIAKLYQDNPFITSSNENISFSSKRNPIYKLNIEDNKLANFLDATSNLAPIKSFSNCSSYGDNGLDVDSLVASVSELPDLYVEIDSRDYFTRLLFVTELQGFDATLTVDLDFSYPSNITITEPLEYLDLPLGY